MNTNGPDAPLLSDLKNLSERARFLLEPLSEYQLNWKPDGEETRWSIGECVQHLIDTNIAYVAVLDHELHDRATPVKNGSIDKYRMNWFERFFVGSMEPPPKHRFKAPRIFRPTVRHISHDVLQRFETTQSQIEGMLTKSETLDLSRIKISSPASRFIRLSVAAAYALIAAHERRHLWQAEELRKRTGFPT